MKRKKIKFNYSALRGMDIVECAGRSPFAAVTRMVTGGGLRAIRDYSIAVHTGIIIDVYGQFLIAEMQRKGLEINSLDNYNTVGSRRWVIDIKRHEAYDDPEARRISQEKIAKSLRLRLEYDPRGLVEFINSRVEDDKARCYCSELAYQITAEYVPNYPKSFQKKVSPRDLQICRVGWYSVPDIMK